MRIAFFVGLLMGVLHSGCKEEDNAIAYYGYVGTNLSGESVASVCFVYERGQGELTSCYPLPSTRTPYPR